MILLNVAWAPFVLLNVAWAPVVLVVYEPMAEGQSFDAQQIVDTFALFPRRWETAELDPDKTVLIKLEAEFRSLFIHWFGKPLQRQMTACVLKNLVNLMPSLVGDVNAVTSFFSTEADMYAVESTTAAAAPPAGTTATQTADPATSQTTGATMETEQATGAEASGQEATAALSTAAATPVISGNGAGQATGGASMGLQTTAELETCAGTTADVVVRRDPAPMTLSEPVLCCPSPHDEPIMTGGQAGSDSVAKTVVVGLTIDPVLPPRTMLPPRGSGRVPLSLPVTATLDLPVPDSGVAAILRAATALTAERAAAGVTTSDDRAGGGEAQTVSRAARGGRGSGKRQGGRGGRGRGKAAAVRDEEESPPRTPSSSASGSNKHVVAVVSDPEGALGARRRQRGQQNRLLRGSSSESVAESAEGAQDTRRGARGRGRPKGSRNRGSDYADTADRALLRLPPPVARSLAVVPPPAVPPSAPLEPTTDLTIRVEMAEPLWRALGHADAPGAPDRVFFVDVPLGASVAQAAAAVGAGGGVMFRRGGADGRYMDGACRARVGETVWVQGRPGGGGGGGREEMEALVTRVNGVVQSVRNVATTMTQLTASVRGHSARVDKLGTAVDAMKKAQADVSEVRKEHAAESKAARAELAEERATERSEQTRQIQALSRAVRAVGGTRHHAAADLPEDDEFPPQTTRVAEARAAGERDRGQRTVQQQPAKRPRQAAAVRGQTGTARGQSAARHATRQAEVPVADEEEDDDAMSDFASDESGAVPLPTAAGVRGRSQRREAAPAQPLAQAAPSRVRRDKSGAMWARIS